MPNALSVGTLPIYPGLGCRNPPNLSWLGTGTELCWLAYPVLFCSLAVLDPTVGHIIDVLSPFISVLCNSDRLIHGESCPRLGVVHPGRARGLPRLHAPGIVPVAWFY